MMPEPIDLVLERLNRMDEKLGRMDDKLARMEGNQRSMMEELRAHKNLIAGALHSQASSDASIAEVMDRIERIEKRLELKEAE